MTDKTYNVAKTMPPMDLTEALRIAESDSFYGSLILSQAALTLAKEVRSLQSSVPKTNTLAEILVDNIEYADNIRAVILEAVRGMGPNSLITTSDLVHILVGVFTKLGKTNEPTV